jgi:hypothetical protein
MGRVSEHLKKFHEHAATHHETLAKAYHDLSAVGKGAKSQMTDAEIAADKVTQCLGKIAGTHDAAAEYHKAAMAECSKAIEASDLEKNQLVPTHVSGVAPDASQNVRAVTRTGAKPFPVAQHAAVGSIDFNKFIGVDELNEL